MEGEVRLVFQFVLNYKKIKEAEQSLKKLSYALNELYIENKNNPQFELHFKRILGTKKKKIREYIKKQMEQMYTHLKNITPVDTGELKENWEEEYYENNYQQHFEFINDKDYARVILIEGIHNDPYDDGKLKGSDQLPDGILPYVYYKLKKIHKELGE
jgi:hypothetical protein